MVYWIAFVLVWSLVLVLQHLIENCYKTGLPQARKWSGGKNSSRSGNDILSQRKLTLEEKLGKIEII